MDFTKDLSKLDEFVLSETERGARLGLDFEGYGVIHNEEDCQSYHVFVWDWRYPKEGPEWDRVKEFLTRDDDNQPNATYVTYFGGQIWNFIVGLG